MIRRCSLRNNLYIERANMQAWYQLEQFHYRKGHPGAVDKVFAIRAGKHSANSTVTELARVGHNETIGVIIYAMPLPNVAMRNVVTGNRYSLWGRSISLSLLNRQLRWISRVVIHPRYRSTGLASWLVRETLALSGTPLVEAMAVMGQVHPFFERAGMIRYDGLVPARTIRMRAAFQEAGISKNQLSESSKLLDAIDELNPNEQKWIVKEMKMFVKHNRHYKDCSIEQLTQQVIKRWASNPVYYIWQNSKQLKKDEGGMMKGKG